MKVMIKPEKCIGCGICQTISPTLFLVNCDGKSQVKCCPIPKTLEQEARDAVERCPTTAMVVIFAD